MPASRQQPNIIAEDFRTLVRSQPGLCRILNHQIQNNNNRNTPENERQNPPFSKMYRAAAPPRRSVPKRSPTISVTSIQTPQGMSYLMWETAFISIEQVESGVLVPGRTPEFLEELEN